MIIYKATNIKNGKVYIGQTTRDFESYIKEHISKALRAESSTRYFHRAIRKHGPSSFIWEIIHKCETTDELNEAEERYISEYKSWGRGGYNMNPGGENYNYERNYDTNSCASRGFAGKKHTDQNKQLYSSVMKAKWRDPEWRKAQMEKTKRRRSDASAMKLIDPNGNTHELDIGLEKFCILHNLPYTTMRRWVNKGKIQFARKTKNPQTLNAIGWEVISEANYYA